MSRHDSGDIVYHGWFEITSLGYEVVLDPCVVVRWSEHNSQVRRISSGWVFWVGNDALYDHPEQFLDHAESLIAKAVLELAERVAAARELVASYSARTIAKAIPK